MRGCHPSSTRPSARWRRWSWSGPTPHGSTRRATSTPCSAGRASVGTASRPRPGLAAPPGRSSAPAARRPSTAPRRFGSSVGSIPRSARITRMSTSPSASGGRVIPACSSPARRCCTTCRRPTTTPTPGSRSGWPGTPRSCSGPTSRPAGWRWPPSRTSRSASPRPPIAPSAGDPAPSSAASSPRPAAGATSPPAAGSAPSWPEPPGVGPTSRLRLVPGSDLLGHLRRPREASGGR